MKSFFSNSPSSEKPNTEKEKISHIISIIEQGRKRRNLIVLLQTISIEIAIPLAYLWIMLWLDTQFHFGISGRIAAFLFFIILVISLTHRSLKQWKKIHFSLDEIALSIERHSPDKLENRIINTVQLAREQLDPALVEAVINENVQAVSNKQIKTSPAAKPLLVPLVTAVILLGAGVWACILRPDHFANAAARILFPLASIEPLYKTTLQITPGDINILPNQDVMVKITIQGKIPDALWIFTDKNGEQASTRIPLTHETKSITHVFESVKSPFRYAVRGGDYESRYYEVKVPVPFSLKRLSITYNYPSYTRLPQRIIETASGEIEALTGTRASLRFRFNLPVTFASLRLSLNPNSENKSDFSTPLPMQRISPFEYSADILLENLYGYIIEASLPGKTNALLGPFNVKLLTDSPPEVQITGIDTENELLDDSIIPITVTTHDDYGLTEGGIFFRHILSSDTNAPVEWKPIQTWKFQNIPLEFSTNICLSAMNINAIEGDKFEIVARARDTNPQRQNEWTTSRQYEILITGIGTKIQLIYEKILKIEQDIRNAIALLDSSATTAEEWMKKFDPASGLRWDDKKNIDALSENLKIQAENQLKLRKTISNMANELPEDSGDIRLTLGILADTEIVRCIKILETVPQRDTPQNKRLTLGDAKLTMERCSRTLSEVLERFILYRKEWEVSHMVPFVKSIGDSQTKLAEISSLYSSSKDIKAGDIQKKAGISRQNRLVTLSDLASKAFASMAVSETNAGTILIDAFDKASRTLSSQDLHAKMNKASSFISKGEWHQAEISQREAADLLGELYRQLREAQVLAAREAISNLQKTAVNNLETQQEIEKLKAGISTNLLVVDEKLLKLEEIIHMRKEADKEAKKQEAKAKDASFDYMFEESMKSILGQPSPKEQQFENLSLASKPTGQMSFPNSSDRQGNSVKAAIQERFEDLVGDLLEEADELKENYETYNLNTAWGINEKGDVGKQGGDLNSTAAAAATGNMKPPTQNFGGASRTGRQGARAHGLTVGNESINRKGRDEAQQGQEEVPEQAGEMKEILSADPQKDTSTGVGGKRIKDPNSTFSTKEAGEWKDEWADKMSPPEARNAIVERKGKPISAEAAERLRDLQSKQEQVIERIKVLKKELDRLYLPTDHLDDIIPVSYTHLTLPTIYSV